MRARLEGNLSAAQIIVNVCVGNTYVLRFARASRFLVRMASVVAQRIAKRVRAARGRAGMTQAALAEAAGITDETVSRIERGAYEPALSTVVAVAEALGLTLDELAGAGHEPPPRAKPPGASLVAKRLSERLGALDPATLRAVLRLVEAIGVAEKPAPDFRLRRRDSHR